MAHPLRARILEALADEVRSPNELAVEFGEPLGNVSYHFMVLRGLGMVELVDTASRRGAIEHYYRARWLVQIDVRPLDVNRISNSVSSRRARRAA